MLSRRWAIFFVVVVLLAYLAWWLGEWQFGRLHDRRARNEVIRTNESLDPAPVIDVFTPGRGLPASSEWRTVSATGTYDTAGTVLVRYQVRDGQAGVDVVVPLVTGDGTALLVDRGWIAAPNNGEDPVPPAPPSGQVTVTGYARVDGTGSSTTVTDRTTRAINSARIGEALGRPVFGGFLDLTSEDPPAATTPQPRELPELGDGPHFFYGLQWWFFGALAVFGFVYLLLDERRHGPRGERPGGRSRGGVSTPPQSARSAPPSTASATPVRYDAAGETANAATRPNSAGSP